MCVIFSMSCWIQFTMLLRIVEDPRIYVHKGYWPIDSYCYCAFLLFWCQGNSGLIEWIGKNFLLLLFFPHNWSKIDVISSLNGWNSTVKPPGPKVYFRDFLWLIQSTSFIFHLLLKIITFSVSCFQILTFNHPTFNQNPTLFAFLLCCSKPTQCLYSHIQSSWDLDTPTKYYPRDSKVGAEAVAWFSDINFHPRFLENICYSLSVTEVSLQFVLMMMTTRKKLPGTAVGMSDRSTLWEKGLRTFYKTNRHWNLQFHLILHNST